MSYRFDGYECDCTQNQMICLDCLERQWAEMRAEVARLKSLFPDADSIGWVFVHRDDWQELLSERDRLRAQVDMLGTEAEKACGRAQVLRDALEHLLVWAEAVKRRAGVRMGDPNTGAILEARKALGREP